MRQGFVSEGEEAQLKEEKDKRGNDGERERERAKAAPRGSIHHTSGGVIRTWEEGFEVWTSKRLYKHAHAHTHFQKYVGLKQMRSPCCPNRAQNKTKGRKGTSRAAAAAAAAASASMETLEEETTKEGDNTTAVLPVTGSLDLLVL